MLALIAALVNVMASPVVTALQATGNIKVFQIVICVIMLCELPLAYLILACRRKPLPGNVPGCTGQFYRSVCTIPDTKETYTDIQIEIFHLFHCPEKSVHSGCLPCDSLLHKIHV